MRSDSVGPDIHTPYFNELKTKFDAVYQVAKQARAKNFDPAPFPESLVTSDVAERVEKAVGPEGIAVKIRELSAQMQRERVALKIAEVLSLEGYGPDKAAGGADKFKEREKAAEQAIRTAAAILDEGVTAAPIQGISSVHIRNNADGTKHLAIYFAGPIRSAGGTDMALILVIANFVRQQLGLDKYKGTELEARRFVEELRLYEREVARFQFHISDSELHDAILYLPIEVNGVETDRVEVSSYRSVPRIDTNRVRGGALRVINDGLIGRSKKVLKLVDGLGIEGWNWLKEIKTDAADTEEAPVDKNYLFMEDIVGGRPIFSFPSFRGGFRLRYGRARNTGLAAVGVHPSTMIALKKFIAIGTQLKLQMPGKAGIAAVVDSIEPPVVKLKNGSVIRLADPAEAERLLPEIDKILFLGDLLVGFGEFLENNHPLVPSGFVEGWWGSLVELHALTNNGGMEKFAAKIGMNKQRLESFLQTIDRVIPTPEEALLLAKQTDIPLHPRYTFFWEDILAADYDYLRAKLADEKSTKVSNGHAAITNEPKVKQLLESLCVPHKLENGAIMIGEEFKILQACLGLKDLNKNSTSDNVFEKMLVASGLQVIKKAPVHVGVRMGRPEKAKRREMKPMVHSLFPIGLAGGARRNMITAAEGKDSISVETAYRKCEKCGHVTYRPSCEKCGASTVKALTCPRCGGEDADEEGQCPGCKVPLQAYVRQDIKIRNLLEDAKKTLKLDKLPDLIKGAQGLTSETKIPEPIEKGVLRAKHDLSIFKDGTIRFDATDAPLTHFTPRETGASIEKLHELGYDKDMNDNPLTSPTQYCALKVHDIIVTEDCGDYFIRVAQFLDELLESFYGIPPFYNVKTRQDLIGQLIIGLSPHTSVGVIGRLLGFTRAKVCFAHPFWHATKRRDCDGDEDSVSLALDMLLNFSKSFLPSRIGGIMDAPILLNLGMNPKEIARQAFNIESESSLPLRFYDEAMKQADPKTLTPMIETVYQRLGSPKILESLGFTHEVHNINDGNPESAYKTLKSMLEKVTEQMNLAEQIKAVNASEVARRVLSTHFMRDLSGNLKAYSSQRLRCTKCNMKYRRIPLIGVCQKCGHKLTLTVYQGGVEKYLTVARDLIQRYDLGKYNEQRLLLINDEIRSLFNENTRADDGRKLRVERAEKKKREEKAQPTLAQFI
jgi:DNA polymerase II large subunit